MLFNTLAVSSLLVALAAAEPAPYQIVGRMSLNRAFGLMGRQQAGYQPTQTYCGPGTDCASSCGTGYVQCASSDDQLHCYDPSIQQSCCPDGSGNSCDEAYYCTSDESGGTWCCPDGMSLAQCAAAYSLTGSLVSETAAATSSQTSAAASTSASTTTSSASYSSSAATYGSVTSTTVTDYSTTTTCPESSSTSAVIYSTSKSHNATVTSATKTASSTIAVFTGGAEKVVFGGFGGMILAAGAALVF